MRTLPRALIALIAVCVGIGLIGTHAAHAADQTLFDRTLRQDIESAGFYELVSWLDRLGLSTRGGRDELAVRLYEHYGLIPPAAEGDVQEPRIIVDAAQRSQYFTIDQTEERYIRLTGGVTVRLNDADQGVVHNLSADEIVFNQDENEVNATGNVEYILERDDSTEKFSGDAVTIDLDDWRGSFLDGVTERSTTVEDSEVDFFFTGEYITRSAQDIVVMEDGTITSSTADPPNYHLTAEKIWVLAPGEWGLRGAVLRVGRVPLFYFPFFFRPGDRLFFNPAFGKRDREGRFIQTTTYLIGKPEADETPLSFLRIAEQEGEDRPLEIDGLYLREATSPAREFPPGWSLKAMTDVYSALGAFLGIKGAFSGIGPITQIDFYAGAAISRNIYAYSFQGETATYSPFYLDGESPRSVLNMTTIGDVQIPIRAGVNTRLGMGSGPLTGSLRFAYYTDSMFLRDFDQRSEQINWLKFLGQAADEPTAAGEISSFEWSLTSSYRPRLPALAPWVDRLQVQEASTALTWRRKSIDVADLSDEIAAADGSPDAYFFVPERLRLPSINLSLAGRLFDYPRIRPTERPEVGGDGVGTTVRPPWPQQGEDEQPDEQGPLRVPEIRRDFTTPSSPSATSATVRYSLVPSSTVEHVTPSTSWRSPEDVALEFAYSSASARGNASIDYSLTLANALASIRGSLSGIGQYRTVFNRGNSVDEATWQSQERQSYSFNSLASTNNLSISVQPLRGFAAWSATTISYTLNLLLYRIALESVDPDGAPIYETQTIDWDEESVRSHQLSLNLALSTPDSQRLSVSASLPPRTPQVSGNLTLTAGPVSVQASTGIREDQNGEWVPQQLATSQTITIAPTFTVGNSLTYDLENREFGSDTATVSYGQTRVSATAASTEGYTFGGPGVGWTRDDDRRLRLTRGTLSSSFQSEPAPFYRNRIRAGVSSSFDWSMNLLRFTENSLRTRFTGSLYIHEFLDLSLSMASSNLQTYAYFGPLAAAVGRQRESVIRDLFKSVNYFDRADRIESPFNLDRITVTATHHLEDWDLDLSYSGLPQLVTGDGDPRYEWNAQFAASLQWRPIPELKSRFAVDDDEITIGE